MFSSVVISLMVALTSHPVKSKEIVVNINEGDNSTKCCIKGECPCSSLSVALQNVENNTIINITSEEVKLEGNTKLGSGSSLSNITVSSDMATEVTCETLSSTTVYCKLCDGLTVNGISWYGCSFILSNSSIVNCTLGIVTFVVSENLNIIQSANRFSDSVLIVNMETDYDNHTAYVNLTISESTFTSLTLSGDGYSADWNITIVNCTLMQHSPIRNDFMRFTISANIFHGMYMENVIVSGSYYGIFLYLHAKKGNVTMSVLSSVFVSNYGTAFSSILGGNYNSLLISDTEFVNNIGYIIPFSMPVMPVVDLTSTTNLTSTFTLNNVTFTNNSLLVSTETPTTDPFEMTAAVHIRTVGFNNKLVFNHCNFISNIFSQGAKVLYIDGDGRDAGTTHSQVVISNCRIFNNTIYDGEEILYVGGQNDYDVQIFNTVFDNNTVDDYIITADVNTITVNITATSFIDNNITRSCIFLPEQSLVLLKSSQFIGNTGNCLSLSRANVILMSTNFIGNIGNCIYLFQCSLYLSESVLFDNNSADKGAALHIDQGTNISISNGSVIQFLRNSASLGGAIFVDLSIVCLQNGVIFNMTGDSEVTFKDNIARAIYSGDGLYYSVSKDCEVNTNTSDPTSLMYLPYHFNYSKLNSTNCCDISCSNLYDAGFPAITSPRYLILCGNNMKQLDDVTYSINNTVLGKPMVFKAGVMDYFKKLAQPVQFNLNCTTCPNDIKLSSGDHILVGNTPPVSLTFTGEKRNFNVYITIKFTSFLDTYIQPLEAEVIVELVPCFNHIGYAYSKENNGCACYHVSVVKCNDHYNEIEDGYWIGDISSQPTTSLCPTRYCSFIHRNKFTLGYSELPDTVDAQCNDHRTGTACGQCSSGYTLTYGTTDCISLKHCSTIMTLIVVVSTCVYWLVIVVGVFVLLYSSKQISIGYTYGIIYYYSMVGILFSSSMSISESAQLFVFVISSFTQLSPQFLGKLCLVKGLSGIDQFFIHYTHPVAVSLLVVVFVIAAKFSPRLSAFVGRCIIRVICLLLLLAYTSIASTSLQLLRPLTFTDIAEVYTYTSPNIQYFHGRHTLYGAVAIVCELIVGIGLPLLLLLEPFVNKKINFVRIKPLLDQFQGCYKDKYRWFASYYLICRQVILLIVFVLNSDYNKMLYYLQTTCVIIATIHAWIQPYKSVSLNRFDAVILQIMVLSVSVNIFSFLQPAATELVLILTIFPLFMAVIFVIRNVIYWLANQRKIRRGLHIVLPDDNDADVVRFVIVMISCIKLAS